MSIYRGQNIIIDGLIFGYDADERSSRFYPGEPTTNIIKLLKDNGSSCTTSFGTNLFRVTALGTKVKDSRLHGGEYSIFTGTENNSQVFWTSASVYNAKSKQITISAWLKGSGTCHLTIYDDVSGYGASETINLTPSWTRYSYTRTVGEYTASWWGGIRGIIDTTNVYVSGVLIEQKSHATQFTETSRSTTSSLIDLKRNTTIDVSNVNFDSTAHPLWVALDTNCIYAELGYSIPTKLTIECLFSPNLLGGWQCVMHRSDSNTVGSSEYWIGLNNSNSYITGTIGAKTGVSGSYDAGITDVVPVVGNYYHVVSTWDGTNVNTYVNGVLKKTYALSSYSLASDPTIRFGAATDIGNTYSFNGKIPIARVYWNKFFTQQDVIQNYNIYKYKVNNSYVYDYIDDYLI